MKKLIMLVLAALGVLAIYRRVQSTRAEQDLWQEATSAPDLR
jgi:hypothetical protein